MGYCKTWRCSSCSNGSRWLSVSISFGDSLALAEGYSAIKIEKAVIFNKVARLCIRSAGHNEESATATSRIVGHMACSWCFDLRISCCLAFDLATFKGRCACHCWKEVIRDIWKEHRRPGSRKCLGAQRQGLPPCQVYIDANEKPPTGPALLPRSTYTCRYRQPKQ